MGMKIRSPKEVLEENKNRKLEIDTTGDIVEKLNKEYEDLYRGKPMKKKMDFFRFMGMDISISYIRNISIKFFRNFIINN